MIKHKMPLGRPSTRIKAFFLGMIIAAGSYLFFFWYSVVGKVSMVCVAVGFFISQRVLAMPYQDVKHTIIPIGIGGGVVFCAMTYFTNPEESVSVGVATGIIIIVAGVIGLLVGSYFSNR